MLEGLVAGRVGGPLQGGDRHVLRLPDVYTTDCSGSGRGSLHHLTQVHTVMIKTMSQITSQKYTFVQIITDVKQKITTVKTEGLKQ